ncbi:zinc ribbon domain-containing protein [Caryophanon latum]|uniref:Zinc-ribbon domain-containing protein n=1 Tax=Caryophanon latum TaxID=33977 RepID=A0A1C0YEI8_9BACL|nr:zinc ribbon domain-containing protein [Caryophanon latum]OCS85555.1 hypothetical protein A6K76_15080 [Caryophanon latum]
MVNNFCSNCGNKLVINSKFCSKCGKTLHQNMDSSNNLLAGSSSLDNKNKRVLTNIISIALLWLPAFYMILNLFTPLGVVSAYDNEDYLITSAGGVVSGFIIFLYIHFFKDMLLSKILAKYTYFIITLSILVYIATFFSLFFSYLFPQNHVEEIAIYYVYSMNELNVDAIVADYRQMLVEGFIMLIIFFLPTLLIKLLFMKRWFKIHKNLSLFKGLIWYKSNCKFKNIMNMFITMK